MNSLLNKPTVFIIDNEPSQVQLYDRLIQDKLNFNTKTTTDSKDALSFLTSTQDPGIDLVLLDLSMPNIDGIEFIKFMRPLQPDLPIIVITGFEADNHKVVESMKAGASDFVLKQDGITKISDKILENVQKNNHMIDIPQMCSKYKLKTSFKDIAGEHICTKEIIKQAKLSVTNPNTPMLLKGGNGVGKRALFRAMHFESARSSYPIIFAPTKNIRSIESMLFGKTTSNGKNFDVFGKVREAHKGTLYIEELCCLDDVSQDKLINLIENKVVTPVGSNVGYEVDIKLIIATQHNLEKKVKQGRLKEKLFYELKPFTIEIPNLSERKADIIPIATYYMNKFASADNKVINSIDKQCKKVLMEYQWPGNVTELKHTVQYAVANCSQSKLEAHHFNIIRHEESKPYDPLQTFNLLEDDFNIKTLKKIEQEIAERTLEYYNDDKESAALHLGISINDLNSKLSYK